jgi:hypothetical protein
VNSRGKDLPVQSSFEFAPGWECGDKLLRGIYFLNFRQKVFSLRCASSTTYPHRSSNSQILFATPLCDTDQRDSPIPNQFLSIPTFSARASRSLGSGQFQQAFHCSDTSFLQHLGV